MTHAPEDPIRAALDHAAHLLPDQGPINSFIHHNTLHAFQSKPFHDAVLAAAERFGAEAYMPEAAYRDAHARGRIDDVDLDHALADVSVPLASDALPIGRERFLRAVMLHAVDATGDAALTFMIDEGTMLHRLRDDAPAAAREALLRGVRSRVEGWRPDDARTVMTALVGVEDESTREVESALRRVAPTRRSLAHLVRSDAETLALHALWAHSLRLARGYERRPPPAPSVLRPRDRSLAATGEDADELVHPVLIRLAASFLDLRLAHWPMSRDGGFYLAARRQLCDVSLGPAWLRIARRRLLDETRRGLDAWGSIAESLTAMSARGADVEAHLTAALLALPGWAGMFHRLERRPPFGEHLPFEARLADFVAVRLALDLAAVEHLSTRSDEAPGPAPRREHGWRATEAYRLFQLFQVCGADLATLSRATPSQAHALLLALDAFDSTARRRVWHGAYERWHERTILSAIAANREREIDRAPPAPRAQFVCCIDEREESLRRAIEETADDVTTHGTAGFFGLAIEYHALDRAHGQPLCPANVTPAHRVFEVAEDDDARARRATRRRWLGRVLHAGHVGARSTTRGMLVSLVWGVLALAPLVLRVVSPRSAKRLRDTVRSLVARGSPTRLRALTDGARDAEGMSDGFSVDDAVERLALTLEELGLPGRFAPLVVVLGHGSTSLNNPHESAHDCGACGGYRGGPNARTFATLLNERRVRDGLASRGIVIPEETYFVAAHHDTASDAVLLFDTAHVPPSHREALSYARGVLERARRLDAYERARRFEAFDPHKGPDDALAHVEDRSESLAEPRPEYGHCTNAVSVVGRRALTRGLFLDRRAFLTCYDAERDPDGAVLERILGAVGPVCAGINLEYYFSFVDNERYGCGTKLPHNIVGLLGVMNGHRSDLRTGLPWQMVEIHEPVRLLFVVEASAAALEGVMARSSTVRELVHGEWVRLVAIDPTTGAMSTFTRGRFTDYTPERRALAVAPTSMHYYRGHLEHLWPARIERPASLHEAVRS